MTTCERHNLISVFCKSIVMLMAFAFVLSLPTTTEAAVMVVEPGESISMILEYSNAVAVDGYVSFSDDSIISNVQYSVTGSNMIGLAESGRIFLYSDNPEGVAGQVIVTVTVHSGAVRGSSCNVTIKYAVTEPGSQTPGDYKTMTTTVTVKTEAVQSTPGPTATPAPTATPVPKADISKLQEQISIAEQLTSYDYTMDSWAVVETALVEAKDMLTSFVQANVDNATNNLKQALSQLVPMDYTALDAALDSAQMLGNQELAEHWQRFVLALSNARVQRTSGDQEAVDLATQELLDAKEALIKALEDMEQVIFVDKEVPVEVLPSDTYCNDTKHSIFTIIMIVSLSINLILTGIIVFYFVKKHRHERDNTPLVDYDIDDDMEHMEEIAGMDE